MRESKLQLQPQPQPQPEPQPEPEPEPEPELVGTAAATHIQGRMPGQQPPMDDRRAPGEIAPEADAEFLEDAPYKHHRSDEAWSDWISELTAWSSNANRKRDRATKYRIRAGIPNALRPKVSSS